MIISGFTDKTFASECSQPRCKVYSSDFLEDGAAAVAPMVSVGAPLGLGSRSWGGCLCTWASLHLGRGSGWALAFTERSLMSCWSQGCPCCWAGETAPALVSGGLQLVLRRSWRSLSTTSIPSAHTVLSSFSFLPLRSLYSLSCPICASPSQNVVEKR